MHLHDMMYLIPTCYCEYQEFSNLGADCRLEYEIGGSGGRVKQVVEVVGTALD